MLVLLADDALADARLPDVLQNLKFHFKSESISKI
jgi:hypothetical protein